MAGPAFDVQCADAAGGGAVLRFSGALVLFNAERAVERARELAAAHSGSVQLDLSAVDRLDGGAAALLLDLVRQLRARGAAAELSGARGSVADILELYAEAARRAAPPLARPPRGWLDRVGAAALEGMESLRGSLGMLGDVVVAAGGVLRRPASLNWRTLLPLLERCGADAAPIVSLITFLVGLVTGFQAAIQLRQVGADIYIADLVALSITRELGPLMTAIIAAGRSGAAFAAELGTMRVSEEIDALHTLGLDPYRFLVLPRVLALVLMLPLLTLLADGLGIVGGLLVGVVDLELTPAAYLIETRAALTVWDVASGLLKAAFFAVAIALIACERGLSTSGGAEGVGRSTTSAVVTTLFVLIAIDAVFTLAFNVFDL